MTDKELKKANAEIESLQAENERLQKDKQPMIVNSIQDDFCGVPCEFMEEKINYLQEENKKLKVDNEKLKSKNIVLNSLIEMKNDTICNQRKVIDMLECQLKTAKAEAYKEFAEKIEERIAVKILKDKSNEYAEGFVDALDGVNGEIDNLLKELVGEDK